MLSFSLVAEALTGLIYHRPSGENSKFAGIHTCLMMGEASLETSPKNNMIQDMINSDNKSNKYSFWRANRAMKLKNVLVPPHLLRPTEQ